MTIFLGRYFGLLILNWADAYHIAEDASNVGFVRERFAYVENDKEENSKDPKSPLFIDGDRSGVEEINYFYMNNDANSKIILKNRKMHFLH